MQTMRGGAGGGISKTNYSDPILNLEACIARIEIGGIQDELSLTYIHISISLNLMSCFHAAIWSFAGPWPCAC